MNIEHRTSNIEHRVMDSVYFKKDCRYSASLLTDTRNLTPDTYRYLTEVTGHLALRMMNWAVEPRINLLVLDFLRIPT
jgi:hypothetical protein